MHFEIHITVKQEMEFKKYCEKEGWKPLKIILLSNIAKFPTQVMCSIRFKGEMDYGFEYSNNILTKVRKFFDVQRMKLEVPYSSEFDNFVYNEMHVKTERFDKDGIFANSINEWGDQKPLLTYRSKKILPTKFEFIKFGIIDYEAETVLIDTNEKLDEGWI